MSYWERAINFVLYSNLWIAMAALAMTWQTQLLFFHHFEVSYLTLFIFVSTLLLYAVHRLVVFQKLKKSPRQARFQVIQSYQAWIVALAGISLVAVLLLFLQLANHLKILLFVPIVLAAGYALPLLPHGKRLRDLPLLKNALIAGVWTWITVIIPLVEKDLIHGLPIFLLSLGRFCFIFAISLPFDIRDMEMDRQSGVYTIPLTIGVQNTKIVGIVLNGITFLCAWGNYVLHYYTLGDCLGISASVLCSSLLIWYAHSQMKDWYYAGLLDSMLIVQFLLVWWW